MTTTAFRFCDIFTEIDKKKMIIDLPVYPSLEERSNAKGTTPF